MGRLGTNFNISICKMEMLSAGRRRKGKERSKENRYTCENVREVKKELETRTFASGVKINTAVLMSWW